MERRTQDPKYITIDGDLANAATREFIPADEPVFIFRAKDIHAVNTLTHYLGLCADPLHRVAVARRLGEFMEFSALSPNKMDEPDTETDDNWPDSGDSND